VGLLPRQMRRGGAGVHWAMQGKWRRAHPGFLPTVCPALPATRRRTSPTNALPPLHGTAPCLAQTGMHWHFALPCLGESLGKDPSPLYADLGPTASCCPCVAVHRDMRDEHACRLKYGKDWDKYCSIVKYRIIPLVY
jgi:hypothetical protein